MAPGVGSRLRVDGKEIRTQLAARVPMGQADRYAVLAAPTLAARVDVLLDAIATVTAMVEFQLSAD